MIMLMPGSQSLPSSLLMEGKELEISLNFIGGKCLWTEADLRENCKHPDIKFYTQKNYHSGIRMEKILSCTDYIPYPDNCRNLIQWLRNIRSNPRWENSMRVPVRKTRMTE